MKRKQMLTTRQINTTNNRRDGKTEQRSLKITGAACMGNLVVGVGKLAMGIWSMSFFTCVSAFYTFGMVTAKSFALAGIRKEENSKAQYRSYKTSGVVLIISSILYIIYSIRLFLFPELIEFHPYAAMGIATVTFTEIALNMRGVIVERKNKSPLMHAIKMINLAASLICLVLTQSAILSFASEHTSAHSRANGFMGILMGGIATILGIVMIVRITRIQKLTYKLGETKW